eukprot:SAG31_NODE_7533_length_1662_cov_1.431222_1_plen_104_part_10
MLETRSRLSQLLASIKTTRDDDATSISDVIPLLKHAANYVELASSSISRSAAGLVSLNLVSPEERERLGRVEFRLKQASRQVPEVSVEFIFGATLSSQGMADIQ